MATISRFSAVAQVGKLEFGGFIAWLAWLVLHLVYLVGFKNRFTTLITWFITFLGHSRGQMAITERWVFARRAIEEVRDAAKGKPARHRVSYVQKAALSAVNCTRVGQIDLDAS